MNLNEQNIMFLTRTMELGGTENVILQLCEILKSRVHKIIVCSCGGVNVRKLEDMGITHIKIPDITVKRPREIFLTIKAIRQLIRQEEITIIHSHHRMAALYAMFTGKGKAILIANAHNTFYDKKNLTRLAYRNTQIIAVGEMVKKNLTTFFSLPEKQITVIHNSVKPFADRTVPVPELTSVKTDGYTLIGNIGRLSEQKGMEYFIKAASIVHTQFPKARFFIVGDGEDAEKLKLLAKKELEEGILFFLGYRSDIQNVMEQIDFIVLSSLWEGLPLTPIEAFSVGKTIVATAVDGTPEIIEHEVNGLLTKSKDVDELAENMLRLCRDTELRKTLEKGALRRYEKEFAFGVFEEKYLNYYRKLTETKSGVKKGK